MSAALSLSRSGAWEAAAPLRERVPKRDSEGRLLADFMMLIPDLHGHSQRSVADVLARLARSLSECGDVVFADFNLKLNLLWVSVRARPGVTRDVAMRVRARVPEALLVGQRTD